MNMSGRWVDGVFLKLSKTFQKIFYNSSNQWTIVTLIWYDDLVWMGTMKFQWNSNEVPEKWQAVSTYKSDKSDKSDNNTISCKSDDSHQTVSSAEPEQSSPPEQSESSEKPDHPPTPLQKTVYKFEEFWTLYPKRKSKQAAEKKYKTLIKSWSVDHDTIVAWLHSYITFIRKSILDEKYIKLPTTWLNQWCRADEYTIKLTPSPSKPKQAVQEQPAPQQVVPPTKEEAVEIKKTLMNRKKTFLNRRPAS